MLTAIGPLATLFTKELFHDTMKPKTFYPPTWSAPNTKRFFNSIRLHKINPQLCIADYIEQSRKRLFDRFPAATFPHIYRAHVEKYHSVAAESPNDTRGTYGQLIGFGCCFVIAQFGVVYSRLTYRRYCENMHKQFHLFST